MVLDTEHLVRSCYLGTLRILTHYYPWSIVSRGLQDTLIAFIL